MRLFHLPARGRSSPLSAPPAKRVAGARTRAWIGIATLGTLGVAGCDDAPQGPDEIRPATSIAIVSGNEQHGNVGFPLGRAFTVRVVDAEGTGVGDIEVTWTVASGDGLLSPSSGNGPPASVLVTHTEAQGGTAAVLLTPTLAGTSTVIAAVVGIQGSPVTFTAQALAADWPPVPGSALIYERTSYPPSMLAALGSHHERYVLYEDGTFGLQTVSGRDGFGEIGGTYAHVGAAFALEFSGNPNWRATGTLAGDCLILVYDIIMALDFNVWDGEFCQPSETT